MTPGDLPPRGADALLDRVLPPGDKGRTILGDLHQEYRAAAERSGVGAARRRYWAEAIALCVRYGAARAVRAARTTDVEGGETMSSIVADLKFGFRMLVRTPGLSMVAVLTIALGVGLTTATYSFVDGTVLRGVPVPDADRLIAIVETDPERGFTQSQLPYRDYLDLAAEQTGLSELGGFYQGTVNLAGEDGPPERYAGAFVTANALTVLGIAPQLGRVFAAEEDLAAASPRVVLSDHVWKNRFAGDPAILGRMVRANGRATEIIGVMPEGFRFPFSEDMWLPIAYERDPQERRSQFIDVFGRAPAGSDPVALAASLDAVAARFAATFPEDNTGIGFATLPYADRYMPPQITAVMFLMLAATLGVLLIACANVANLLLARASIRTREVAIRTAIGASRFRVIRQMLSEAVVISLMGGALGIVLAKVSVVLMNGAIISIQKPYWIDIRLDAPSLLFAMSVTMLASLAAGTYPAFKASGVGLGDMLRDEARGSSSLRLGRFSATLVVAEVAVSCALLVAAGLMIKSVANLRFMDLGFNTESVLTGRVGLFESDYPTRENRAAFFEELETRLQSLPGAQAVAMASSVPGLGGSSWPVTVEGETYATARDHPIVTGNVITAGLFEAIDVAFLQGRDFTPTEPWDPSETLAIVNESFARTVLGGRDPLGMRVKIGRTESTNPFARIIGVVPDLHIGGGVGGIGDDLVPPEQIYIGPGAFDIRFMSAIVRTQGPPEGLAGDLRRTVTDLDPNLPVYELGPLALALQQATWAFGLFGSLFTIFGAAALFLAGVGLYGVMAFSVSQRRQELGVRMALGAGPREILRMVLRRGVFQLSAGMVIGLGLGYLLAQPMSAVTFGVGTTDPMVYGAIVLTLSLAGLAATIIPARSAMRADPASAMRP